MPSASLATDARVDGSRRTSWGSLAAIACLFVVAAWLRVHNALGLFPGYGFDEAANWEYVRHLSQSWALPDPESMWSAARPPLFFYASALLARAFDAAEPASFHAIRIASSAVGLGAFALAVLIGWRRPGRDPLRVVIAAGLVCFVPAHVVLSAMVNEEVLVTGLTTLALLLAILDLGEAEPPGFARPVAIGVLGGLAFLTKLTGCLVVIALAATYAVEGWRRGRLRPMLARALVLAAVAAVVGGWFYARSLWLYGYLYPHSLDGHAIMLSMPPGERGVLDYLRVSWAAVLETRANDPGILHSVWNGTYQTWWFDGHRHFVPRSDPVAERMGRAILLLGLLPTAAALAGAVRGVRRARRAPGTPDAPMLALVAITLAGYVLYTWRNPWFATVKAHYLLGLAAPYAWWASERLGAWCRRSPWLATAIGLELGALLVAILLAFGWGTPLWEMRGGTVYPGLPWRPGQP